MTHLARRSRPALRGSVLIAAVVTIAATSAAAAVAAPTARLSARPSAISLVPLRQVGPGWSIAEYSASSAPEVTPRVKGPTTLYAVSPQGHKYAFYHWPATSTGVPAFSLLDWSGDKQRVLVQNFSNRVLEQISLATGKVVTKFALPRRAAAIGYTRPAGLNVLAIRVMTTTRDEVVRYDLTGHLTKVLVSGRALTNAIEAPDGKTVIVGTASGLLQVSNLGGVVKRMHPPVTVNGCNPVRWWNSRTVLGNCFTRAKGGFGEPSRLWLFPVGSGKVTALTGQRNGTGVDLGDIAAWKVTSGVYLQALGGCGSVFIAKQYRNGSAHVVTVPGTANNNHIVTALQSRLLVWSVTECIGGNSLLWFNPGTSSVQYAIHPPKGIEGVFAVIPYGRPLA